MLSGLYAVSVVESITLYFADVVTQGVRPLSANTARVPLTAWLYQPASSAKPRHMIHPVRPLTPPYASGYLFIDKTFQKP